MSYTSVDEICKEFGIDPSLSVSDIIVELTKKQKELHPDVNPEYNENDAIVFSHINDAKVFLRQFDHRAMISLSEVEGLIKLIKNTELSPLEQEEKIKLSVKTSCERIAKNIKNYYLPRKLTVSSVMVLVSFIWAFPSMITEHPFVEGLASNRVICFIITLVWLFVLFISLFVLLFAYKNETYMKNLMFTLEDVDNQYNLFYDFIDGLDTEDKSFSSRDLEKYIRRKIYSTRNRRIPKQLLQQIDEIVPKIAEMIIYRAIEKGVISKENKRGWYDTYIVMCFEKNN